MNRPAAPRKPPAIVLAAFGTASDSGRKVFDTILTAARRRYPRHDILIAFTARSLVETLRREGIETLYLPEAPAELLSMGHRQAVWQPLMVMPGSGYARMRQIPTDVLQVAYGLPLITKPEDLAAVVEAVAGEVAPGRTTVFVLHGSNRSPEDRRLWLDLAEALEKRFPGTLCCLIEGMDPAKAFSFRNPVHFVPMMLTCGNHVRNDVMGDHPRSWKNRLDSPDATCAMPLGCNAAILDIFFRRLDEALKTLPGSKN